MLRIAQYVTLVLSYESLTLATGSWFFQQLNFLIWRRLVDCSWLYMAMLIGQQYSLWSSLPPSLYPAVPLSCLSMSQIAFFSLLSALFTIVLLLSLSCFLLSLALSLFFPVSSYLSLCLWHTQANTFLPQTRKNSAVPHNTWSWHHIPSNIPRLLFSISNCQLHSQKTNNNKTTHTHTHTHTEICLYCPCFSLPQTHDNKTCLICNVVFFSSSSVTNTLLELPNVLFSLSWCCEVIPYWF